ncbi:MAG TPA: MaoC/PaaZ C-terminal domain-containing protein [Actinomycetota bacterium]|nr:MaoC/PaaZ C-terminal domain-containing protein [Actinomycetota bacterium]
MPINHDVVGRWYPESTYEVTADAIQSYADAVNDPNPAYRKGDDSIAPPLFPIVAGWNAMAGGMGEAVSPDLLMMLVHLIQDMRFERPIRAGDVLTTRGRISGISGGERGTTATGHVEYKDADGGKVGEFYATIYIRGHTGEPQTGEPAPPISTNRDGEPVASVEQHIDEDITHRYAEASGDHNPIHLDPEFARSVGLPGIINHGMNTLAHACWAAVENLAEGDPARLTRFAGRFSKPVLPGQTLTTTFWRTDSEGVYAFETTGPDGAVIKDGVAEIR